MRWVIFGGFNDQVGQVLTSYRSDTGSQRPLACSWICEEVWQDATKGSGQRVWVLVAAPNCQMAQKYLTAPVGCPNSCWLNVSSVAPVSKPLHHPLRFCCLGSFSVQRRSWFVSKVISLRHFCHSCQPCASQPARLQLLQCLH